MSLAVIDTSAERDFRELDVDKWDTDSDDVVDSVLAITV